MNSALSKLIVSFRAAKHKQNRRFALAVIFIPNFKEDGTMRRSNGTGAVVKLPGHRRKPYAARITSGKTITASGNVAPKRVYLGYFRTAKEAQEYLNRYAHSEDPTEKTNVSERTLEYQKTNASVKCSPTFSNVYGETIEYLKSRKRNYSDSTYKALNAAYNNLSSLHSYKFRNIDYQLLQEAISKNDTLSKSSLNNIRNLLKKMYTLALKQKYVTDDISKLCDYDYTTVSDEKHHPFTHDEINLIRNTSPSPEKDMVLILLYTGIRAEEFLILENKNIHLDDQYFITGVKTDAGKSRIIPIHNDILPIIQKYCNPKKHYFWDFNGSQRIYQTLRWRFDRLMKQLNINHIPHDTRHTTATAMHNANLDIMYIKLILGHHINDITQRVYIHSNPKILVDEINKMKL